MPYTVRLWILLLSGNELVTDEEIMRDKTRSRSRHKITDLREATDGDGGEGWLLVERLWGGEGGQLGYGYNI